MTASEVAFQGANQWSEGATIPKSQLEQLIAFLREDGYAVIGPKVEQSAIVYAEIESTSALPRGYSDDQSPGKYRLVDNGGDSYFQFNVGPQSWKQFLFPPRVTVASAHRDAQGWHFDTPDPSPPKLALLGVRACELAAIAIQDR